MAILKCENEPQISTVVKQVIECLNERTATTHGCGGDTDQFDIIEVLENLEQIAKDIPYLKGLLDGGVHYIEFKTRE